MADVPGRRLSLSLPRRWIADLMHLCRQMPVASIEKELNLKELATARRKCSSSPSWLSLFIKAYALTAKELPALRQSYQSFPYPHLYESSASLAAVAIAREFDQEPAVFFGMLNTPEQQSLPQISQHLQDFKTKPLDEIKSFSRMVRISRYPGFVRRLLWWFGYHWSGRKRAKTFGTFGVSVLGASGVTLLDLVFPSATTFTLGPIDDEGRVLARLFFDHRVLDGATATQALLKWEAILQTEMLKELEMVSGTI